MLLFPILVAVASVWGTASGNFIAAVSYTGAACTGQAYSATYYATGICLVGYGISATYSCSAAGAVSKSCTGTDCATGCTQSTTLLGCYTGNNQAISCVNSIPPVGTPPGIWTSVYADTTCSTTFSVSYAATGCFLTTGVACNSTDYSITSCTGPTCSSCTLAGSGKNFGCTVAGGTLSEQQQCVSPSTPVPTTTTPPTTASPTTPIPTTPTPTTPTPTTPSPTTPSPTTPSPTTAEPTTAEPTTTAPVTPTTESPATDAPTTATPTETPTEPTPTDTPTTAATATPTHFSSTTRVSPSLSRWIAALLSVSACLQAVLVF